MSADTSSNFSLIKIIPLEINIAITGTKIDAAPINAVVKAVFPSPIAHIMIAAKIDNPPTKNPILCNIDDARVRIKPSAPNIAASRYKKAFAKSFNGINMIIVIVTVPFLFPGGEFLTVIIL